MPGSMIHLLAAHEVNPNGSAMFYLGNIAPDAVADWHDKDSTHFRDLDDRGPALKLLAERTADDFAEGVLLHLYFDWKWDTAVRQKFIDKIGDAWFTPYRKELSLAGSYAFHHTEWAKQVWDDMDSLDAGSYGETPRASAMDVKDFVSRNNKWHNENVKGPSPAFPADMIYEFIENTVKEYAEWLKSI